MKDYSFMSLKTLSSHFKILSVSTHTQTVLTCGNQVIMTSYGSAKALALL